MTEKYFCCSGPKGCGRLYIGASAPEKCSECGNTYFKQGLENLGFRGRQELAEHKRAENNNVVKKQYRLFKKKP